MSNPKLELLSTDKYRLLEDYSLGGHTVPKDYLTDLDTVPRWTLIFYCLLKSRSAKQAIFHDWFYKTHKFSRHTCDLEFLRLMDLGNINRFYSIQIFLAVRLFGWIKYRKHRAIGDING